MIKFIIIRGYYKHNPKFLVTESNRLALFTTSCNSAQRFCHKKNSITIFFPLNISKNTAIKLWKKKNIKIILSVTEIKHQSGIEKWTMKLHIKRISENLITLSEWGRKRFCTTSSESLQTWLRKEWKGENILYSLSNWWRQ